VLSGNEFVGTLDRKRAIAALHGEALLVDMEAAGVAQIAHRIGLPFVVAKTVSDRLQPDGTIESDFRRCLEAAARNAASVLRKLSEPRLE
jgi:adenosylhomocysteine nucleosidase